jgi:hypothetical protein
MYKLIGSLAILLAVGCYVGTDIAVPTEEKVVLPDDEKEDKKPVYDIPKEDFEPDNCEDAYQILIFHEETTNSDIIVLIPIPCDPRPFIDLGRPAPITL